MEIYLDLVFLENFLMDFILLLMVGKLLHKQPLPLRLLAAALVGSNFVCAASTDISAAGVQPDRRIVYAASELPVKTSGTSDRTFVFVWKCVCTGRDASLSGTVYGKQRTAQAVFPFGNGTFWLAVFSFFVETVTNAEAQRGAALTGYDPLERKADRLHRTSGYGECPQGTNDRKAGHDRGTDTICRK